MPTAKRPGRSESRSAEGVASRRNHAPSSTHLLVNSGRQVLWSLRKDVPANRRAEGESGAGSFSEGINA